MPYRMFFTLDGGSAYLTALKENHDPSLAQYADMQRRPDFDQAEIDRIKASWIAGIRQEKAQPNGLVQRVEARAKANARKARAAKLKAFFTNVFALIVLGGHRLGWL